MEEVGRGWKGMKEDEGERGEKGHSCSITRAARVAGTIKYFIFLRKEERVGC